MNKTTVRKKQQYINQNTIESQRTGSGIVQQVSNTLKNINSDMWSQLLGTMVSERGGHQELSGDLVEGKEVTLGNIAKKQKANEEKAPALNIEPGIDYRKEILYGERKIANSQTQEIATKIQEIIIELKRLTATSRVLQVEFKEVATEQRITKPGKYHQTFFEWMLSVIRQARIKVEDSGAWLAVAKSKQQKRQYWAMFKKHGTSFGLSNERIVATQTG